MGTEGQMDATLQWGLCLRKRIENIAWPNTKHLGPKQPELSVLEKAITETTVPDTDTWLRSRGTRGTPRFPAPPALRL